jgi:hypothetical protein
MPKKIILALNFLLPLSVQLLSMELEKNKNKLTNNDLIRFSHILKMAQKAKKIQISKDEASYHKLFEPLGNDDVAKMCSAFKKGFYTTIIATDSIQEKKKVSFDPKPMHEFLHAREKRLRDIIETKDGEISTMQTTALQNESDMEDLEKRLPMAFLVGLGIGSIPTVTYVGIKAWSWFQERK